MCFRLFILTACRVIENKRFLIVRVLMFPVAALIIKSFSLLSSIKKKKIIDYCDYVFIKRSLWDCACCSSKKNIIWA